MVCEFLYYNPYYRFVVIIWEVETGLNVSSKINYIFRQIGGKT